MLHPILAGAVIGLTWALAAFLWGIWRERRIRLNQRRALARTLEAAGWWASHPRDVFKPSDPVLLDTVQNRERAGVSLTAPWTRDLRVAVEAAAVAALAESRHGDHADHVARLADDLERELLFGPPTPRLP